MADPTMVHPLTRALVTARTSGIRTAAPGDELGNLNRATALQIQHGVVTELGTSVAGWKVAVLVDGDVIAAPIIAERLIQSPASLPQFVYGFGGVECEIAFKVARAPIATGHSFSRGDILASLGGACVAVEILDSRWVTGLTSSRNAVIADLLSNGALVVGGWIDNWHQRDFASLGVALDVNDRVAIERQGGHASGDLVDWVVVLANHIAECGQTLQPGQVRHHRQFHRRPLCRSRRQDDGSGSGFSFALRHLQTNSTRLRGS
jgi:2-keto-4-pentenoate hydratase